MLEKITAAGWALIRILTGIFAVIFLTYSLFTLWDMYRTEIKAFASYDLLQYRPNIEQFEPPYLDDLLEINPDTTGWLTIYGTNIDYPVMQGKDDMDYLNKTATLEYSVSGSIFLSMLNKRDYSEPYCLVYGHHMENGSMFGDIDKFKKEDFFRNVDNQRFKKNEGVLILENIVYNLKVFAVLETDAYDEMVYRADKYESEIPALEEYLKTNSLYYTEVKPTGKILAMSTCDASGTDARTVLFCRMKLRKEPLPTREKEPLTPHREAVGHPMAGAYWSIMDLTALLLTIYAFLPVHVLWEERKDIKKYIKIKQIIICLLPVLVQILLFILTQNLHKPMQLVDVWTPVMILFLAAEWFIRKSFNSQESKNTSGSE